MLYFTDMRIYCFLGIILLLTSCSSIKKTEDSRLIYLVRHAEKEYNSKDPSLTVAGKARAESLKNELSDKNISRIYSTAYNRTRETVQPLSHDINVQIENYDPSDLDKIAHLLKSDLQGNVLVVGHSNTTPTLINLILGEERYDQLDDNEYGDLFIIELSHSGMKTERKKF